MPAYIDIREGMAEAFNVLSEEFTPDAVVKLLKASDSYDEFDELLTVSSNRFFEYTGENRQKLSLEIADDTAALTEAMAKATHVGIDDDVYTISLADPLAPKSTGVTWKIAGDLFEHTASHYSPL